MSPSRFYDDLADYYDLIYPDWERSMARQGEAIDQMLRSLESPKPKEEIRVLDIAAGIGTQTLPLATLGYDVTARDLSGSAVARLSREAEARGLSIDAAQADMRAVSASVEGRFDVIIAFDNAIPHLQNSPEITRTFQDLCHLLVPGGALILSVRDYDKVDRSPTSSHPYGERARAGDFFRLGQKWEWLDSSHYRTTLVVEQRFGDRWTEIVRTSTPYYAIPVAELLELMGHAGLISCRTSDIPFNQPVLLGQREQ